MNFQAMIFKCPNNVQGFIIRQCELRETLSIYSNLKTILSVEDEFLQETFPKLTSMQILNSLKGNEIVQLYHVKLLSSIPVSLVAMSILAFQVMTTLI